jgi:hypothetical protein
MVPFLHCFRFALKLEGHANGASLTAIDDSVVLDCNCCPFVVSLSVLLVRPSVSVMAAPSGVDEVALWVSALHRRCDESDC